MRINALKIRQAFGEVLKKLQKSDEPIIIEKGRKPVAVLISIEMFNARFIDFRDAEKKAELLARFKSSAAPARESSLTILRESRYG
jgi:prevent-host-death family protein